MNDKEFDTLLGLYNNMHEDIKSTRKELNILEGRVNDMRVEITERLARIESNHKHEQIHQERWYKTKMAILGACGGIAASLIFNIDVLLRIISS